MRMIDADALDMSLTELRFNKDGSLAHWGDRSNWYLRGDEVEKLIQNAPTVRQWISVNDRLPEPDTDVLWCALYTPAEYINHGIPQTESYGSVCTLLYWIPLPKPSKEGETNCACWMPLPEPPEEGETNCA